MTPFTKRTVQVLQQIPKGRVMTYGQVAKHAGNARAARQVVRVLHTMSTKYNLPWHRVINRQGKVTIQDEELKYTQLALLKDEGVFPDESGRISLQKYSYKPKFEEHT